MNVVLYDASLQKLASSFQSGNVYLDRFIKGNESLNDAFGKTYVYLSDDKSKIIGYYNLGVGYIEQLENGRRVKIGGAVPINCFAFDEKNLGLIQKEMENGITIKLSDFLLVECMERIERIRENHIGFSFVTLNATQEGYHLYLRNGFEDLEADMSFSNEKSELECKSMYMAIDVWKEED